MIKRNIQRLIRNSVTTSLKEFWSDHGKRIRHRRSSPRRRTSIESLEDRCLLATATQLGNTITYTAFPGEANDVDVDGSIFTIIDDDDSISQFAVPPCVHSEFLESFELGFEVGFIASVTFSFNLLAFDFPSGALCPSFLSGGGGFFGQGLATGLSRNLSGGASAIAGMPLTQGGGYFLEVGADPNTDPGTISAYEVYHTVVSTAGATIDTEPNDSVGAAQGIAAGDLVQGTAATGDRDVYSFTAGAGQEIVVIMNNDPELDGSNFAPLLTISDSIGLPLATTQGLSQATALGAINSGLGGTFHVEVERTNLSAADTYEFVVIVGPSSVGETEPANDTATGTPDTLTTSQFGDGAIGTTTDTDFWSIGTGAAGDRVFAYVDTQNALPILSSRDSTLTLLEADGTTEITSDNDSGQQISPTEFNNFLNELDDQGVDVNALTSLFTGGLRFNLGDKDDTIDLTPIDYGGNGQTIFVDGGAGNDVIMHGGGNHDLMGGPDQGNDTFVFNGTFSAGVTLDGGGGFDDIDVTASGANEIITVRMADDPDPTNDPDTIEDDLMIMVEANGNITTTYYRDIATSNIEALGIDGGGGDDLIIIDYTGGVNPGDGFTGLPAGIAVTGGDFFDELRIVDAGVMDERVIFRQGLDQSEGIFLFRSSGEAVGFQNIQRHSITPHNTNTGQLGGANSQLTVFDQDPFEYNDDPQNASFIEHVGNRFEDLNIDLPPDTVTNPNRPQDYDWFEFRAPKVGTFSFEVFFERDPVLAGADELDIALFSENMTLIANGTDVPSFGEVVSFSAATDQSYFLRVQGSAADNINVYDIQVVEVDLVGPQVYDPDGPGPNQAIQITGTPAFNLFDIKDSNGAAQGATPRVDSITINLQDILNRVDLLPADLAARPVPNGRAPGIQTDLDLYPALDPNIAGLFGHYEIRGDQSGLIPIQAVNVQQQPVVAGAIPVATVELIFAEPLPDDRFTLTIKDSLIDPPGNAFDGQSNAAEPVGNPTFPSGDGTGGGDFVARFTVDSRPEPATYAGLTVTADINGNLFWDPTNTDATNRDLAFHFGSTSDQRLLGKFDVGGNNPGTVRFDVLAAYGFDSTIADFRLLIDDNLNGAFDAGETNVVLGIDGLAVAGNWDGNAANGDEIAVYTGAVSTDPINTWSLFRLDGTLITSFLSNIAGFPIAGDFDGDGLDDLATFQTDTFFFDLANDGFGSVADPGGPDATITPLFALGVGDRPVAADMDLDGIDDIGLWLPNTQAQSREVAEWRFLLSNDTPGLQGQLQRVTGTVVTLDHAWSPRPLGNDLFAEFGDPLALPLLGNLDPPLKVEKDSSQISQIVGRNASTGDWQIARSNGSSFTSEVAGFWSTAVGWVDINFADVTGDGLDDIVGRDPVSGDWWVGVSDGSGYTNQQWGHWTPINWGQVHLADVDGDGNADLVGRNQSNGQWWVGLSDGTGFTNHMWGAWTPANWVDVQIADVNGDNRADIVGRNGNSGQWWVALSNGSGFTNQLWGAWAVIPWSDVNITDVNGDGLSDIVGRETGNGRWWVSLSDGTSFTNSLWGKWSNSDWVDVSIADVNGDGMYDIIGRELSRGRWWASISTGAGSTNVLLGTWNASSQWLAVQVGDFDGDGNHDVAGRNAATGQWQVGRSTGTSLESTVWGLWDPAAIWDDVGVIDELLTV